MRGEIDLVILAGGAATRLGSLGNNGPKALLPVLGRPFIAWQLAAMAAGAPIRRVVICARSQHANHFRSVMDTLGYQFVIIEETEPMGTGGAILSALAQGWLSNPFLVMNGDVIFPADIPALANAALQHGAALTAIEVPDRSRFGALDITPDNRIRGFFEKPKNPVNDGPVSGVISAGLYAFMHESLQGFPLTPCSFEYDIAPELARRGWLGAVQTQGGFLDIGTPLSYAAAPEFIAGANAGLRRA